MAVIQYAIDIDIEDASKTDATIGLQAGVFRFITGRPGYDGTPTYPKWEDDTDNTFEWYEGFLLRDNLGNPSRRINLERMDGYATLSGFDFSLKNDPKFWDTIQTAGVYLNEKKIRFFVVMGDKFYQAWTGEVTNNPYTETDYKFICKDTFRKIHTKLPPKIIERTDYPDASDNARGKPIPVCVGEVPYAQTLNLEGNSEAIPVVFDKTVSPNVLYYACGIRDYTEETSSDEAIIDLEAIYSDVTPGIDLSDGEYYLRVVSGGDTELLILINDYAVDANYLVLRLSTPVPGLAAAGSGALYDGSPDGDTWYVQIVRLPVEHVVSNGLVSEFKKSTIGNPILNQYSSDDKKYTDASSIIKAENNSSAPATLDIINTNITTDGDLKTYLYYTPDNVYPPNIAGDPVLVPDPLLTDRDRSTVFSSGWGANASANYKLEIPQALIDANVSSITIAVDIDMTYVESGNVQIQIYSAKMIDTHGNEINVNLFAGGNNAAEFQETFVPSVTRTVNTLPNDYYTITGGVGGDTTSYWGKKSLGADDPVIENLTIDSAYLEKIRNGYLSRYVLLNIRRKAGSVKADFEVKDIGFLAEVNVDIIDGSLYARVQGEQTNAEDSNTVYNAFRLILEDYDGLASPTDIDYGNVDTTRNNWYCGRQLVEQKMSHEYLKQLCQQSFVALFPSRTGKRKLSAWFDKSSATDFDHDNTVIVRESIRSFTKTKIEYLYNDFNIKYSWNPGLNDFDAAFAVTKVNESAFPAVSGDWTDYVQGLDAINYGDAKYIWDVCHNAFLRSGNVVSFPDSAGRLTWFIDRTIFESTLVVGTSTDSSAWRFLKLAIFWNTNSKNSTQYSIPLNTTNIQSELCDYGVFRDLIYTNDLDQEGWITKIEINTKNDLINIGGLFWGDTSWQDDCDIEETGSAGDTVDESGSRADTIEEGA